MEISIFQKALNTLEAKVEKKLISKHWEIKLAFFFFVLSIVINLLLNPSALIHFKAFWTSCLEAKEFDVYSVIKIQSADISKSFLHFKNQQINPWSHESKMTFRLFLPVLAKVLNFKTITLSIYTFQILAGFLYLYLLVKFSYRLLKDKTTTFIFLIGFTGLYASNAFFYDITGYGDSFAYLFILAAIYTSNPLLIFSFCFICTWIDERALVNLLFPIIWWQFVEPYITKKNKLSFLPTFNVIMVILPIIVYSAIRIAISNHYQLLETDNHFIELKMTFLDNLKNFGFKLWSGFESFWLFITIGAALLLYKKEYTLLSIWMTAQSISIAFAFVAYDTNRSLSYGYLSIFIALVCLKKHLSATELKILLLFISLIALLFPSMNRMILPGHYILM